MSHLKPQADYPGTAGAGNTAPSHVPILVRGKGGCNQELRAGACHRSRERTCESRLTDQICGWQGDAAEAGLAGAMAMT